MKTVQKSWHFFLNIAHSISSIKGVWQLWPVRVGGGGVFISNDILLFSMIVSFLVTDTGHQGSPAGISLHYGIGLPNCRAPRFQASRWLEFTIPKWPFVILHEAKERVPDHHLSPLNGCTDSGFYFFLSCLLWGRKNKFRYCREQYCICHADIHD